MSALVRFGFFSMVLAALLPVTAVGAGNRRPTIRPGLFMTEYGTQAKICDENAGLMLVRIKITRVDSAGTTTHRTITRTIDSPSFVEGSWACGTYSFHNAGPSSWYYAGKFTYDFRVRDTRGVWSRPYVTRLSRGTE